MDTNSKAQMATHLGSRPGNAEQRLKELDIKFPAPPEPFGTYVEAAQTDDLLFLSGMLPTETSEILIRNFILSERRIHMRSVSTCLSRIPAFAFKKGFL